MSYKTRKQKQDDHDRIILTEDPIIIPQMRDDINPMWEKTVDELTSKGWSKIGFIYEKITCNSAKDRSFGMEVYAKGMNIKTFPKWDKSLCWSRECEDSYYAKLNELALEYFEENKDKLKFEFEWNIGVYHTWSGNIELRVYSKNRKILSTDVLPHIIRRVLYNCIEKCGRKDYYTLMIKGMSISDVIDNFDDIAMRYDVVEIRTNRKKKLRERLCKIAKPLSFELFVHTDKLFEFAESQGWCQQFAKTVDDLVKCGILRFSNGFCYFDSRSQISDELKWYENIRLCIDSIFM